MIKGDDMSRKHGDRYYSSLSDQESPFGYDVHEVRDYFNSQNELIEKGILLDESSRKMLRKLRKAGTQ